MLFFTDLGYLVQKENPNYHHSFLTKSYKNFLGLNIYYECRKTQHSDSNNIRNVNYKAKHLMNKISNSEKIFCKISHLNLISITGIFENHLKIYFNITI